MMNIESRVLDIARDIKVSITASDAAGRLRSVTSKPGGDSTREPEVTQGLSTQDNETRKHTEALKGPVDVQKAVEELNKIILSQKQDVSFSVDEDANATVIKFFESKTGELIKQFPPEEILAMIARLRESVGWLVDKKA